MAPFDFHVNRVFDAGKHREDPVAREYLERTTENVQHFIPVHVTGDGNCLYSSMLVFMEESTITISELRGELVFYRSKTR
jgi:hypothetical protein